MRGPKLNEGATMATLANGERHGTKATAKYVRSSAYKARAVLDLIRGLDVVRADQVLQFTDRSIAADIRKVLASAVANASNPANTGSYIADPDELFVLACFADEGPTLRRFRPRARGRATRIRKRTCHITVVVARMSEQRLAVVMARAEGSSASDAARRRARVERSRTRTQAAKSAPDATEVDDVDIDDIDDVDAPESTEVETVDVAEFADVDDAEFADVDDADRDDDDADVVAAAGEFVAGEWVGSVVPDAEGNGPDTHLIKGNADSMLYHTPDSRYYKVTKAEVWFDTEQNAEAAGFAKPGAKNDDAANDDAATDDAATDDEGAN
jgi:large subunit ribosomal protein L22